MARWCRRTTLALVITALSVCLPARGAVHSAREHEIKAALVYNFTRFADWPDGSFRDEESPIVLAVVGVSPFGKALELAVRDQSVRGRPLVVRYYRSTSDVEGAHVVFLARGVETLERGELSRLHALHVLTVGETAAFQSQGGIIRLIIEGRRVRLRVNSDAARRSEVRLSSQLLRIAAIHGDARAEAR